MASSDNAPDLRYYGCHEGVVVNNRDPKGLHRVRIEVPGLTPANGSVWAWPMGMPGSGSPQRGVWDVPDKGAEVYVWFLNGDPDKPRYLPGHWGRGEEPTAIREAKDEVSDPDEQVEATLAVKTWETKHFRIVIDERDGKERLFLHAKPMKENLDMGSALMLELDMSSGVLAISGPLGIALRTTGLLDLQGTAIRIGGRPVVQGVDQPI